MVLFSCTGKDNNMPTINMTATGKNIHNMIKAKKMTIAYVQDVFGFNTPQAIYKWFRGDALPTIDNLVILANILETTVDGIIVVNAAD